MSQSVIGGVILGIIGILLLINPHGVWAVAERWKALNALEATPVFLLVMRIIGIISLVIGVLVCFAILK